MPGYYNSSSNMHMNEGYTMMQNTENFRNNYGFYEQKKRAYDYGDGLVANNPSYGRYNTSQRNGMFIDRKQMRN
jgi:hypothetical protein